MYKSSKITKIKKAQRNYSQVNSEIDGNSDAYSNWDAINVTVGDKFCSPLSEERIKHHYDAIMSSSSVSDESSISRLRSNSNQLDRYSFSSSPIEREADDDTITFSLLLKFAEKFPSVHSNLDIAVDGGIKHVDANKIVGTNNQGGTIGGDAHHITII